MLDSFLARPGEVDQVLFAKRQSDVGQDLDSRSLISSEFSTSLKEVPNKGRSSACQQRAWATLDHDFATSSEKRVAFERRVDLNIRFYNLVNVSYACITMLSGLTSIGVIIPCELIRVSFSVLLLR